MLNLVICPENNAIPGTACISHLEGKPNISPPCIHNVRLIPHLAKPLSAEMLRVELH